MYDWISDVAEHIRSRDGEDLSCIEVFAAMAASHECSAVWAAIEKRLGEAEAIHKKAVTSIFRETDIDEKTIIGMVQKDLREEAVNLADTVNMALRVQHFSDAATVAQRNKLKERFTKSAQTMIEVLRLLEPEDYGVDEVDRRFAALAREIATQGCDSLAGPDSSGTIRYVIDRKARTIAEFVALGCVGNPIRLLETMRDGVSDWADTPPLIPRPDATNARRLRLIRELSGYFKSRYGTPLRSCVLAITGVFFDSDGLDESTIAKLAP